MNEDLEDELSRPESPRVEERDFADTLTRKREHVRRLLAQADGRSAYPLSVGQRRMWLAHEFSEKSTAYHVNNVLRVEGRLCPDVIARAAAALVSRHEALRTRFLETDDAFPLAVTAPNATADLIVIETPTDDHTAFERLQATADRPFDLAAGPLLRIQVTYTLDAHTLVLLSLHHIVADGWSIGLLLRDFLHLYREEEGRTYGDPLPATVPFSEFVSRQQGTLTGRRAEDAKEHWAQQLEGPLPRLRWPADRVGSAPDPDGRPMTFHFDLPVDVRRRMDAICGELGITRFMFLLAAFAATVRRYGSDDLLIGSPVSNRIDNTYDQTVGYLGNTVPVRLNAAQSMTLRELLLAVRSTVVSSLEFQDVPFDAVLDPADLDVPTGTGRLFPLLFVLQTDPADACTVESDAVTVLPIDSSSAKADVVLHLNETDEQLAGRLEVDCSRLYGPVARELAEAFQHVVATLPDCLGLRLDDPELLPACLRPSRPAAAASEERGVDGSLGQAAGGPGGDLVHEAFDRVAAQFRERVAVLGVTRRLTYAQLERASMALARDLRQSGVTTASRVCVALERGPEAVVTILAILRCGGVYVPLDPAYPASRIAWMIEDCRPVLVVAGDDFTMPNPHVPRLQVDMEALLAVDGARSADTPDASLTESASARPARTESEDPVAYVMYTSGSTGTPKGVEIGHRAILALVADMHVLQIDHHSVLLHSSPLGFDASTFEIFAAVLNGAALVPLSGEAADLEDLVQTVERHGVTVLWLTVGLFSQLADRQISGLRTLKALVSGGDVMDVGVARRFLRLAAGVRLFNVYGPTENTTFSTMHDVRLGQAWDRDGTSIPIGRALDSTRAYVLDEEGSEPAVGESGELVLAGPGLARGYRNRPELAEERFRRRPAGPGRDGERVYHTGDIVRVNGEREFEFLGRLDRQVKVRGYRVELGEIQTVLRSLPRVLDAYVTTVGEGTLKQLVAYVVGSEDSAGDDLVGRVRADLAEILPGHMLPAFVVQMPAIPLLNSGKYDVAALPNPRGERQDRRRPTGDSSVDVTAIDENHVVSALRKIWADVLQTGPVATDDDFFELGGDSIRGIQIVAAARRVGITIRPRDILRHRTIRALAAAVNERAAVNEQTAAEPTRPDPNATTPTRSAPSPNSTEAGTGLATPIQRWWHEQDVPDRNRFTMSQVFELAPAVNASALTAALADILRHHPALRRRHDVSGPELLIHGPVEFGDTKLLSLLDLSSLDEREHLAALQQQADQVRHEISLADGRLLKAVLVLRGALPDWLLVIVHHVAIDAVSWQILTDDLSRACRALAEGVAPRLDEEVSSADDWVRRLQRMAVDPAEAGARGHWLDGTWAHAVPRDLNGGENTRESAAVHHSSFSAQRTRALLEAVSAAPDVTMHAALVGALGHVVASWTGQDRVSLMLEGHGREDLDEEIDLSRTVGWFTSLYPVTLRLGTGDDVSAQLSAVPHNGLSYGVMRYLAPSTPVAPVWPDISFNYMGILDGASSSGLLKPIPVVIDGDRPATGRRPFAIEVGVSIEAGELHTSWTYSQNLHSAETVEKLARHFEDTLHAHSRRDSKPLISPEATADPSLGHDVDDVWPTIGAQEGMIYHSIIDREQGLYLVQWCADFEGRMDIPSFAEAWQSVLSAHEALRVSLHWDGQGHVRQAVHCRVQVPITVLDWTRLSAIELDADFETLLAEDRLTGFDITHAPLLRLHIIRIGAEQVRVVWTYHHALVDGWTFSLLLDQVHAHYRARVRGHEPPITDLPSYRDYVRHVATCDTEADRQYWTRHLKGISGPTVMPLSRPAQGGAPQYMDTRRTVDAGIVDKLISTGRSIGVSLNTLCLGAWALVLARYSGETQVTVGVTGAGRSAEVDGIDRMVGLFINTLPLRIDTDAPHIDRWLQRIQADQWEMREHEHNSLTDIRQWVALSGDTPLFESIYVFENYPVGDSEGQDWDGAELVRRRSVERTNYDLEIVVKPDDELVIQFGYNRSRYEPNAIETLLDHYLHALIELAEPRTVPTSDVDLADDRERRSLLERYAPPVTPVDPQATIHSLFEQRAAETPTATAVRFREQTLTYRELDERANALAHLLRARGVGTGSYVGLSTTRGVGLLIGVLGILKAGGAYVPISPKYPPERVGRMAAKADIMALVATRDVQESLLAVTAPRVYLEDVVETRRQPPGDVRVQADDPCYIYFTSGSTGTPKGVSVSHGSLYSLYRSYANTFALEQDVSAVLQMADMSFDVFTADWVRALCSGKTLVLCPAETLLDGQALYELIVSERIDFAEFVPVVLRALADHVEASGASLAQFSSIVCSSDVWYGEEYERFRRLGGDRTRIVNVYGVTEATIDSAVFENRQDPLPAGRPVPLHAPLPDQQLFILDETLRLAPIDVPGELCIGGNGVGEGYLHQPALTAERYVPAPDPQRPGRLYRTGDMAVYSSAGHIELIGRMDSQVKIRGFRIELGEVERVIKSHGGVQDAAAVVRRDGAHDDAVLVVYVVPRCPGQLTVSDVLRHLKSQLPWFMIPSAVVEIDEIPVSANQKVDRSRLPRPSTIRPLLEGGYVPPKSKAEQQVARIWEQVLQVDRVGVTDDFIELGGNSLRAMQVATQVQRVTGQRINIKDVLLYSKIHEFVEAVGGDSQIAEGDV